MCVLSFLVMENVCFNEFVVVRSILCVLVVFFLILRRLVLAYTGYIGCVCCVATLNSFINDFKIYRNIWM